MVDIALILETLANYENMTVDCNKLMEKWYKESEEYKENAEFDHLADEYFGK